jgi:hypothetical protein
MANVLERFYKAALVEVDMERPILVAQHCGCYDNSSGYQSQYHQLHYSSITTPLPPEFACSIISDRTVASYPVVDGTNLACFKSGFRQVWTPIPTPCSGTQNHANHEKRRNGNLKHLLLDIESSSVLRLSPFRFLESASQEQQKFHLTQLKPSQDDAAIKVTFEIHTSYFILVDIQSIALLAYVHNVKGKHAPGTSFSLPHEHTQVLLVRDLNIFQGHFRTCFSYFIL